MERIKEVECSWDWLVGLRSTAQGQRDFLLHVTVGPAGLH